VAVVPLFVTKLSVAFNEIVGFNEIAPLRVEASCYAPLLFLAKLHCFNKFFVAQFTSEFCLHVLRLDVEQNYAAIAFWCIGVE